ncbi:dihydrofolate reductase [Microbacterium sp. HD4P20]|uniref:dihydrofolate reductase family protein n=1 Tax=Microbacterium sp. HD4P20 TaxID=2864874 RepID=UPI001C643033|nr:dihydrofolate reductase [Microbacterium sp. HD4P20]MCP2638373.1 dihydrofolate reductase [Microbacterium sp. HD4P20]
MRELTYYIGMTLDGFIAGPHDEVDFYPLAEDHSAHMNDAYPEVLPTHVRQAIGIDDVQNRGFDTVVMGRRTYDPALEIGITSPYAHLRQIVVSRSMDASPDSAVELVRDDPRGYIRELKAQEGLGIYLAGGGRLAGELLPEIDRLIVKKYPVVAGSGLPAFAADFAPVQFALEEALTFSNGCAVLRYRRR